MQTSGLEIRVANGTSTEDRQSNPYQVDAMTGHLVELASVQSRAMKDREQAAWCCSIFPLNQFVNWRPVLFQQPPLFFVSADDTLTRLDL
jgi:hypothetical protein